jgi:TP901 family phage tail tape measure protein
MATIGQLLISLEARSDKMERELGKARADLKRFGQSTRETAAQARQASEQMAGSFARMQQQTAGLAQSVAALPRLFAGWLAASGIMGLVRHIAAFEDTMAKVRAVTQANTQDMQRLTQTARQLGATTAFSAAQAAEGMAFLGQAGFNTEQILSAIGPTLSLASAGTLDLGRAADIVTNIMSGFGAQAGEITRYVDVLAQTASMANTNIEQLGNAMVYVAPVASALRRPVEETAAAIGVLSSAGIQAEKAGTGLRRMIERLIDPPKDAQDALTALKISVASVNPASHDLSTILRRLAPLTNDTAAAFRIFGAEGASAALALIKQRQELDRLTRANEQAAGRAREMARIQEDTLGGALRSAASRIADVVLQLGESGLSKGAREAVESITRLSEGLVGLLKGLTSTEAELATLTGTQLEMARSARGAAADIEKLSQALLQLLGVDLEQARKTGNDIGTQLVQGIMEKLTGLKKGWLGEALGLNQLSDAIDRALGLDKLSAALTGRQVTPATAHAITQLQQQLEMLSRQPASPRRSEVEAQIRQRMAHLERVQMVQNVPLLPPPATPGAPGAPTPTAPPTMPAAMGTGAGEGLLTAQKQADDFAKAWTRAITQVEGDVRGIIPDMERAAAAMEISLRRPIETFQATMAELEQMRGIMGEEWEPTYLRAVDAAYVKFHADTEQAIADTTKWRDAWVNAITTVEQDVRDTSALEAQGQALIAQFRTPRQELEATRAQIEQISALLGTDFAPTAERAMQQAQLQFARTTLAGQSLEIVGQSIADTFQHSFQGIAQGTQTVGRAFQQLAQTILAAITSMAVKKAIGMLVNVGLSLFGGAAGAGAAGTAGLGAGSGPATTIMAQHGAVITGPTLAMMGENPAHNPEYVFNRQQMQRMASMAAAPAAGPAEVNVIVVDSRAKAEDLMAQLPNAILRTISEDMLRGETSQINKIRRVTR